MVVCGISKMFHRAVERLLILILVKIKFLVLQRIEIAFHRGVIIRASSLAHALRQVMCFAKVGKRLRCVRAALIAMKNQTFDTLSLTAECFAKRSDCQVTRHTPIRQPCDNAAVMKINNRTVISDIASMEK